MPNSQSALLPTAGKVHCVVNSTYSKQAVCGERVNSAKVFKERIHFAQLSRAEQCGRCRNTRYAFSFCRYQKGKA